LDEEGGVVLPLKVTDGFSEVGEGEVEVAPAEADASAPTEAGASAPTEADASAPTDATTAEKST
jgi:hypothetical protein